MCANSRNFAQTEMQLPKISVIIPTLNRSNELKRAIKTAKLQTLEPFELIVIDDGSAPAEHDAIKQCCNQFGARLIRHERNRGAAAARNSGMRAATGDYMAFLDSDDEWLPNKLDEQWNLLVTSRVQVCASAFHYIRSEDRRVHQKPEIRLPAPILSLRDLVWGCTISPGSGLMISRALVEQIGPQDTSLRRYEDWDWLIRIACRGEKILVCMLPLFVVRQTSIPKFEVVEAAAERLVKRHESTFRTAGLRSWLRFRSTIELELASVASKNGKQSTAVSHAIRGIAMWPLRNFRFWRKSATALLKSGMHD